jgi:hypothetical protein
MTAYSSPGRPRRRYCCAPVARVGRASKLCWWLKPTKTRHPSKQMGKVVAVTELRFERWYLLLSVPIGLGPKNSEVRVADGTLHVKMGWAFDAHIPLASITKAEAPKERAFTWGVHYSRGRWLVNGSRKGLVALTIEPTVQARAAGRSVKLRSLWVSVTDPDALIAATTAGHV